MHLENLIGGKLTAEVYYRMAERAMECKHKFNFTGDQKGANDSARYFRCEICGAVKIRSSDGTEYIVPGVKEEN